MVKLLQYNEIPEEKVPGVFEQTLWTTMNTNQDTLLLHFEPMDPHFELQEESLECKGFILVCQPFTHLF